MSSVKNRAHGFQAVKLTLLFAALAVMSNAAAAGAAEIYYQNDFEHKCDVVYWTNAPAMKVQVDEIALTDENPFPGSKRCAKIVFHVTEGSGYCYFSIPLDIKIDPAKSYVAEAAIKYQSTGGVTVGFGHSWVHTPKGKASIEGCYLSAGMAGEPGQWERLVSSDLMESYRATVEDLGYPPDSPDCPGRFDALYIATEGLGAGARVTIWLDDVKLRSATDEDRARLEKEKRPFDYVPPAYPQVEEACPWGVCGDLEFHAASLGVPLEIEAAVAARHWAQFGWDTALHLGGIVIAPGSPEQEDYLGRVLDLHAKYDIRLVPSTLLTGYYGNIPHEKCEETIRRVVTRFRDHPALLAWWMIDEPVPSVSTLRDQWIWGKQQFEALDKKHPALGALNSLASINMYSPYTQIAVIDCYPLSGAPDKPTGRAITVAKWCEQAWNRGARRIWAVPQTFGECAFWPRLPSPAEVRLETWLFLSRGSTGVMYYYYPPDPAWLSGWGHRGIVDLVGLPTEMGEEIIRLAGDVPPTCSALVPVRWTPQARVSVESDKGADGNPILDVGRMTGKTYDVIIVSNLDTKAARSGKVRIEQEKDRALYDLRALQPVTAESDGAVALNLQAGDAAVLLSGDANAFAEAKQIILARRLDLMKRGERATVAEAVANGIPATWDAVLSQAGVAEKQQDYAGAIGATGQAQRMAEAAMLADARYSACRQPFDKGTLALSRASRALEVKVLPLVNGQPDALKVLQADAVLMTHVKTLKELARCQHLLCYTLWTGRTADMAASYRDFETLAAQAEAGVAAFIANRAAASPDAAALKRLVDAVAGVKP